MRSHIFVVVAADLECVAVPIHIDVNDLINGMGDVDPCAGKKALRML